MHRREFTPFGTGHVALAAPGGAAIVNASETSRLPCADLPEFPDPMPANIQERLFPGFVSQRVKASRAEIFVLKGGSGPPLLLLHGHPETHVAWHKIASSLAKQFTVILPDLRGYGDSSKPDDGERHRNYSFRSMANDQRDVMKHFGFETFYVAGHDRGGRVCHRLCLDHPDAVRKVAVLDIAPTLTMYRATNKEFATRYVWWFLQIQPAPFPEHFISLDPEYYLRDHLTVQSKTPGAVTPEAMQEYLRCYCCLRTIHATCEDYRAAADLDLEMDEQDDRAGHRVSAPLLALWGAKCTIGALYDVLATWREKAVTVSGRALDCGHLLPEERPQEVLAEFETFFR